MRIFQRNRPCEESARLSTRIADLEDRMDREELRYRELYEIARRNLAKLAQRAASENGEGDDLSTFRKALVSRKLNREA